MQFYVCANTKIGQKTALCCICTSIWMINTCIWSFPAQQLSNIFNVWVNIKRTVDDISINPTFKELNVQFKTVALTALSSHGSSTCRVLVELFGWHSTDPWGHLKHLRKVVQAHTKAGMKIHPKKTKIFQSEVEYLGHKDGGLYQECAELATPTRCSRCPHSSIYMILS